jgi:precorrin-3B synthase
VRAGENFCPGVLHAVPAKGGSLIRIRVQGGLIEAAQLLAVADLSSRFADGTVEITSRANLQIRALQSQDLAPVAREITAAGLLPSATHDRVRNIITSPLAGLEAEEIIDIRAMILERVS